MHLPAAARLARRPARRPRRRPADRRRCSGGPGPNVGYAVTLAERLRDKVAVAPHEHARRRVAVDRRAGDEAGGVVRPGTDDAPTSRSRPSLLGYQGDVDAGVRATGGPAAVHGADHEYGVRRAVVDAVPDAVLRMPPQVPALLGEFRAELQRVAAPHQSLSRGHGSGSRPRRRARCTSAARAPRCSTGSTPATTAGTFVLRIEDTDVARSREEWVVGHPGHAALARPRLGRRARPARAPRFDVYLAAADRLLAQGDAYECYCTEDEVRERNDAAIAAGPSARLRRPLPRPHRRRARRARRRRPAARRSGSARPTTGSARFTDLIRGEVRVEWALIHDFVIVRSDGAPIFFLANAVDDIDMGITHVIRGEDLIDSTHRVLALRAALGGDRRARVRAPAADRRRRVAGQAVEAPRRGRARGLPQPTGTCPRRSSTTSRCSGGRRPTTATRCSTRDELVAEFDLDRVTHAAAGFDREKLDWLNGEWIRRLDARRPGRARRARSRGRASVTTSIPTTVARRRSRSRRSARSRSCRSSTRWRSCSSPTPTSRSHPSRGRRSARTDRVVEVLDAVDRARRDRASGRSRRSTSRPVDRGARHQAAQGDARGLRRGRGPPPGPAAVRLDRAARAGPARSPASARARATRLAIDARGPVR